VASLIAYVAGLLYSDTNGASLRADGGVVRSIFQPRPITLGRLR
jgi:hypothetical protein